MGLIKAALGAAGGVMADQWKEYFYCESIPENVMAVSYTHLAVRLLPKAHIQFCAICVTDTVRRTFADRQCAQCAHPLPLRLIPCQQNANAQFFRSLFRRLQRFGLRRYLAGAIKH